VSEPSGPAPAGRCRLDLAAIRRSLERLSGEFPAINARLDEPHEPLSDVVVDHLLAGYELVDQALADGTDLFAFGHSQRLLELNARVLCGRDPAERQRLAAHLAATEQRFYDDTQGGIRDVIEWYDGHQHLSAWRRAAGVYVRALSAPQLWLEGNHRSGAVLMSWILARAGHPPVVPMRATVAPLFACSSRIKLLRKGSFGMLLREPRIRNELAQLLERHADPTCLHGAAPPTVARAAL
jgi:hypothetical protein